MSKLRMAGCALGVAIMLFGFYEMAVAGNYSAFIFISGGFVITALAAGVFSKEQPNGASFKVEREE